MSVLEAEDGAAVVEPVALAVDSEGSLIMPELVSAPSTLEVACMEDPGEEVGMTVGLPLTSEEFVPGI